MKYMQLRRSLNVHICPYWSFHRRYDDLFDDFFVSRTAVYKICEL